MKLSYSGNKVLVTGGSSSIGRELSKLLISEGLFPILTYRNEVGKEKILKDLADINVPKDQFETAFFDFKDTACINDLFTGISANPDYLVDLAQTDYESLVASASCEKMDQYFQENIAARAQLVRAASRSMLKKRFGRLIFISSAAVNRPGQGQGFYTSSKLACEALYKNCGLELSSRGITSLTIRPGYVDAGRGHTFLTRHASQWIKEKKGPIDISITDLCQSILFFMSDSACSFNGVAITMDNGLSAGR